MHLLSLDVWLSATFVVYFVVVVCFVFLLSNFHCKAHAYIEIFHLNGRFCQQRQYPVLFRTHMLSDKCSAPDKLHSSTSSLHYTKQSLHSQANSSAQLSLSFSNLEQKGIDKNTERERLFLCFVHFCVKDLLLLFVSTLPHWC